MTQTVPATCVLGPGKTGLTIGYRVLNLDGTVYSAFSTTDVAETSTAGTYRKANGVVVPLAGGYIVWGTALVDYAEATVESTAVNVTLWQGDAPADLDASGNVPTVLADAAHGGSSATLALKSVTVTNNDMGGKAVALTADATTGTGLSISGWKAIDAAGGSGGDFVGNLTGTVDEVGALNSNAQQNVADALKSAPTAGDPTPGSVYAYLAAAEPADIWSYVTRTLTQSSTSTTDSTTAGSISRRRGDSWSISLTLGAITGYTSLWFTVKAATSDPDTAAIFQIKKNASGSGDGLLYVNGATASSAALGSITVSDATTGAVIIALDETITDDLTPASYVYDCQALISGSVSTPDSGTFTITADVTRVVV